MDRVQGAVSSAAATRTCGWSDRLAALALFRPGSPCTRSAPTRRRQTIVQALGRNLLDNRIFNSGHQIAPGLAMPDIKNNQSHDDVVKSDLNQCLLVS